MVGHTILLFGGTSSERRVSVASAMNVAPVVPGARLWFVAPGGAVHAVAREALSAHTHPFERDFVPDAPAISDLPAALDRVSSHDVLFLALHGGEGEDGALQAELERRGLAFTGSGAVASAAAFDKVHAKRVVEAAGVRVARTEVVQGSEHSVREALQRAWAEHRRIVVKPVADGSSVGVHLIDDAAQLLAVAATVAGSRRAHLVEPFLVGTELTVGVIEDDGGALVALPPSEVRVEVDRAFDFSAKYLGRGARELTPAEVGADVTEAAQRLALTSHRALGCSGYSRTDMIVGPDGPTFLELNSLPGLTAGSFLPQQLAAADRTLAGFVQSQLALAVQRRQRRAPA